MGRLHTMTALRFSALLVLALGTSACNGSELKAIGGVVDDGEDTPPRAIDPGDPHNDGQDTTVPEVVPTDWDTDGDGIPDGDDNIPCQAFYMKVWNQNVSSASVELNDQIIVDESFFPTTDIIQEFINPMPGVNTLELGGKLTGSPEDQLHIEIWDVDGALYLHETAIRAEGQPTTWSVTFILETQC